MLGFFPLVFFFSLVVVFCFFLVSMVHSHLMLNQFKMKI
jgi:hypothetical protein